MSRLENGIPYACAISLLLLFGLSVAHITSSFLALSFPSIFAYLYLMFYIDRWTRMNIVQSIRLIIAVIHFPNVVVIFLDQH